MVARDGDAGGDDRTDFGTVLAGLIVPPPAGEVSRPGGAVAAPTSALGAPADHTDEAPQVQSTPLMSAEARPSSRLLAPPDAPGEPTSAVDAAPIVLEPAAPATAAAGLGTEERVGSPHREEEVASPPQVSLRAAQAAAEVMAGEIVRLVARDMGGGSPAESAAGRSPREGAAGAPAPTAATQAGTEQLPARRAVAEDVRQGAGLAAPLAGLRELVRGTTARGDGAPTDLGEPTTVGRGDTTAAVESLPVASARLRAVGGASDAALPAVPAVPRYEGAAHPSAAPPDGEGDEIHVDPVAPAQARDSDAEMSTGPLVKEGSPPSAESAPHPLTASSAVGGGSRDMAAPVVRSAAPAPPPPPAPPPALVPTSHATLDLALGDGTTGRLRVAVRGDVVHATILAEGAAAITLERELPSLRRSLAERGFPDAQLTVRAAIGEAPLTSPPPTSGAMPERPATGRERDEGTPRHPQPEQQDPTEDQRSRERRRPPQPEEYP